MATWKDKAFEFFQKLKRSCSRYGWPPDDFETFSACFLAYLRRVSEDPFPLRTFKRGLIWALFHSSFVYPVFKYYEACADQEKLRVSHFSSVVARGVFSRSFGECFKRMRKAFIENVLNRSHPLITRTATHFVTPRVKLEDLLQEAAVALLEQFDKGYDPSRGRFLTMCNSQMRHRFIALQRGLNYQITFPVWVNKFVNAARSALVLGDHEKFEEALNQLAGDDNERRQLYRNLLLASTNETLSLFKGFEEESGRREEWLSTRTAGLAASPQECSITDQWFQDAADYISELIKSTNDITLIEAWQEFQDLKGEFEKLSETSQQRLRRFILEELQLRPPYDPASETPHF